METFLYPQSDHSLILLSSNLNKGDTSTDDTTLHNRAAVLTEISQRNQGVEYSVRGPDHARKFQIDSEQFIKIKKNVIAKFFVYNLL
jgi:hypothetical protein